MFDIRNIRAVQTTKTLIGIGEESFQIFHSARPVRLIYTLSGSRCSTSSLPFALVDTARCRSIAGFAMVAGIRIHPDPGYVCFNTARTQLWTHASFYSLPSSAELDATFILI